MPNIILTEGSGTLDALYGNFQAPIVSHIEEKCEAWEQTLIFPHIFREQKIETFAGGYTSSTAMDDWEAVGENGAHPSNGFEEGYSKIIKDMTWKSQFGISQEMVEDQQLGRALKDTTKFVNSYYRTKERFFAEMLAKAAGGNASMTRSGKLFDLKSADGKNLFATDHPSKVKGGNQTNKYQDSFSGAAWGKAITAMQNLKGDNGEILGLCPDTLVIPNIYSMVEAAYAYVNSHSVPGSDHNDANPLYGNQRVIIWPYLNEFLASGAAPWFVMDSKYNMDADGLIYQNRLDLTVRSVLGENDENIWKGRARFAGGFVDWRAILGGGLTGGSSL